MIAADRPIVPPFFSSEWDPSLPIAIAAHTERASQFGNLRHPGRATQSFSFLGLPQELDAGPSASAFMPNSHQDVMPCLKRRPQLQIPMVPVVPLKFDRLRRSVNVTHRSRFHEQEILPTTAPVKPTTNLLHWAHDFWFLVHERSAHVQPSGPEPFPFEPSDIITDTRIMIAVHSRFQSLERETQMHDQSHGIQPQHEHVHVHVHVEGQSR